MNTIKTFSISEAALSTIAVVLTVGEILYRLSVMVFRKTVSIFVQLLYILAFATVILLAYLIFMAISTAMSPWFNPNIQ